MRRLAILPAAAALPDLVAALKSAAEAAGAAFFQTTDGEIPAGETAFESQRELLCVTSSPPTVMDQVWAAVVFVVPDPRSLIEQAARHFDVPSIEAVRYLFEQLTVCRTAAAKLGGSPLHLRSDWSQSLLPLLDALELTHEAGLQEAADAADPLAAPAENSEQQDDELSGFAELLGQASSAREVRGTRLTVGREIFQHGDLPDEACPSLIDICGRSRILVFGPYISLWPGIWRADVTFALCADAAMYPYLIEFGSPAGMDQLLVRAKGAGTYSVDLTHRISEPARVEIRMSVLKPAFHGHLAFGGADLRWYPVGDTEAARQLQARPEAIFGEVSKSLRRRILRN